MKKRERWTAPAGKRERWTAPAAMMLAAVMAVSMPFPALAAIKGPGVTEEAEVPRYDAETQARLDDNVVEYDEIALRVREYNPDISRAWDTFSDTKDDYANMVLELESQYRVIEETVDTYVEAGKMMGADTVAGATMIAAGKTLDSTYRSTMQGMRDTVNGWDGNRTNTKQLRNAERQVTMGVQQALIGFETIRQNIATLESLVTLYSQQKAMMERMQQQGLGTQTEILSADSSLLSAQSQLLSLRNQQESLRMTLCQLLGYDPNSEVVFAPIPEFDMSRLDDMDLEADTVKAIGNNQTLISQRKSEKGSSTVQVEARLDKINEGDQKLTIEMQRLYQDVMDKKAAYQAALVGYEAAEKTYQASVRQHELGMLSAMQFTGTQLAYYQKKAAKESANLALLQAMETYDWAVAGFAAVQ